MPADLYSDAETTEAAPAAAAPAEAPETTAADEMTAELPKTVLGGQEFKPGDEVVLEIVQVTENSVIVKYASGEEEGEYEEEPEAEPESAPAPGSMGEMME